MCISERERGGGRERERERERKKEDESVNMEFEGKGERAAEYFVYECGGYMCTPKFDKKGPAQPREITYLNFM